MRPSWVAIDVGAIEANTRELAGLVAPSRVCAVVKADAYGHGDVPVAEAALRGGASLLAVALVEEGVRLREAGIEAPIMLLSEPAGADAREVVAWDLVPTVYRPEFCEALEQTAQQPIEVHIKVDTGMHRVGADPSDFDRLAKGVSSSSMLDLAGIWTHLAVAEDDPAFTTHQLDMFDRVTAGFGSTPRHAANTAGSILYPRARYQMVRPGLGVYGLHPGESTRARVSLHPAMSIVSHVAFIRELERGARPSYGRLRPLPEDGRVATVPIGYADGLPRAWMAAGGEVLIGGRRYPLAGQVTMDQIVVDVGADPVSVGDEVVLLGRQGDDEIAADEWAARLGTINYEIVCQVGPRLPRRYVK